MAAYVIGGSLYFCPVISIYLSLFLLSFFPLLVSEVGDQRTSALEEAGLEDLQYGARDKFRNHF